MTLLDGKFLGSLWHGRGRMVPYIAVLRCLVDYCLARDLLLRQTCFFRREKGELAWTHFWSCRIGLTWL